MIATARPGRRRSSSSMDYSIADDNDFDNIQEENDAAYQDDYDEPPPVATDSSSEVIDETVNVAALRQGSFAVLPYVLAMVEARRAGDVQAAEQKMRALRKHIRSIERRSAALQHAISGPITERDAAAALLEARQALVTKGKRKVDG